METITSDVDSEMAKLEGEEDHDNSLESIKILAWDYSGSTHRAELYHKTGKKYLDNFCKKFETTCTGEHSKPIYLTWSNSCTDVTLLELRDIIIQRKGTDGTSPSSIISWIVKNIPNEKLIELWLITDGEIDSYELRNCSVLNQGIKYSRLNFIVVNPGRINMSVGASFFRGAKLRIFYNDSLFKEINTSKPYDYDSVTLEHFDSKWEELRDFIQAKFMGSDIESLEEAEKLSALRRRLLNTIDAESVDYPTKHSTFPSRKKSDLLEALKSCQFYKSLIASNVRSASEKIDASISTLINYIHNKHRSCNFDTLKIEYKQDKMNLIEYEAEPDLDNLDELEKCTIFDAVTLENEQNIPVLLISVTDLIDKYWINGNYSKFRSVMDCPLLVKMDCIGHIYTYETFKSLCASDSGTIINPMTNQSVHGGLIFNEVADDWNDYVLMMSFFRGKKIDTCLALWYYVIWENAKKKPWIESAVVDMLKSYAFRRIECAKVRLAFGKLPLDPKEIVPIHVACYYCAEGSSLMFGNHHALFMQEKLRHYWPVVQSMLNILDHFGYDEVDEEFVMKRSKLFEIMTNLKRIPREIEKRYFLLEAAFESQGPFLTYVIKDKIALKFLNLLKYHHKASMIPFNFDECPVDVRSFVLVSYDSLSDEPIKLCSNTFRPYFVVKTDSNGLVSNYNQILNTSADIILDSNGTILCKSKVNKLDQSKLTSLCKMYIDLTVKLGRFPTIEKYSDYLWKAKRFYGNQIRLFSTQILSNIQEIFALYSKPDIDVDEFIRKTKKSIAISDRIEMEQRLIDQNAEEFITKAKDMLVRNSTTTSLL